MEFGISRSIQLTSSSLACRRPARKLVADLVSDLSQTGSSYLDISSNLVADRFAAGLLATSSRLVCDLLASC